MANQEPSNTSHWTAHRRSCRRLSKIVVQAISGVDAGRSFVLDQSPALGGRSPLLPIVLEDPSVSTMHFELSFDHEALFLRDLGSKNGTIVQEAQLRQHRAELRLNSTFQAGAVGLKVLAADVEDVQVTAEDHLGGIYGRCAAMRELFGRIESIGPTPLRVLIQGETGTGKEGVAQALHDHSGRSGDFVVLDCAAQPAQLFESALFGHKRGSFSGAFEDRKGLFEQAHRGTLFIDEIGDLPLELQSKLLRVLETGMVAPIGSHERKRVDARIVSATHRDLAALVQAGEFRLDLLQRIQHVQLRLPPLRDRREDIPLLVARFLELHRKLTGRVIDLEREAQEFLGSHRLSWPGNVRQLRHVIETAAYTCSHQRITPHDLASAHHPAAESPTTRRDHISIEPLQAFALPQEDMLREMGRLYLQHLVQHYAGNIDAMVEHAGYSTRSSLYRAFDRFGVPRPKPVGS